MNSEDFMVQDVKHSLDHGKVKLMYWRDGKYRTVKRLKIEKPKNRVRNFRVKLHLVFGRLSALSLLDRLHELPSLPPAVISRSSKHVQRFPAGRNCKNSPESTRQIVLLRAQLHRARLVSR